MKRENIQCRRTITIILTKVDFASQLWNTRGYICNSWAIHYNVGERTIQRYSHVFVVWLIFYETCHAFMVRLTSWVWCDYIGDNLRSLRKLELKFAIRLVSSTNDGSFTHPNRAHPTRTTTSRGRTITSWQVRI